MFHVEQMNTNDKSRGEYGIESHFTDKCAQLQSEKA